MVVVSRDATVSSGWLARERLERDKSGWAPFVRLEVCCCFDAAPSLPPGMHLFELHLAIGPRRRRTTGLARRANGVSDTRTDRARFATARFHLLAFPPDALISTVM
jgi:hypothetical protein